MTDMLKEIFNNSLCAEWMVAFGTLLLAIITFVIHLVGDSYTRLIKDKYNYEFKKKAFDFLSVSLASWSNKSPVPGTPEINVEEHIDKFYGDILDHEIYLSYCNRRRLNAYVSLAKKAALAWDNYPSKSQQTEKCMRNIAKEMKKMSKSIGKEKDIKKLIQEYPWLFEKKCFFKC